MIIDGLRECVILRMWRPVQLMSGIKFRTWYLSTKKAGRFSMRDDEGPAKNLLLGR